MIWDRKTIGIFYVITAIFLSLLPALNGYAYIAVILFILAFISPARVLLAQWVAWLLWLAIANVVIAWERSLFQMPDEYNLYLLHALTFILGFPFYVSHNRTFRPPWMRLILLPIRYVLLSFGVILLITVLFRPYPISNIIWALICLIYGYCLERRKAPMRPLNVIGYILLFSMLTLATLVLLEIGARFFLVVPPASSGYYMPHPEAIFTFLPNSSGAVVMRNNDGEIISFTVKISSQGIRDREHGPKSPNEFRIVMLGDSFTMGHGLAADEMLNIVLERMLLEEDVEHGIRVINCGVGGYGPWQERVFLQERGFGFEPDLVILQLYPTNDVADSYSKVGKYLDAIDVGWGYRLTNYRRQNELPFRLERFCQRKSSAYRLVLAAMNSQGFVLPIISEFRLFPQIAYPRIVQRSERPHNEEVCLVDWYPELEEAWGIFADSIRGIRDDCHEQGIDLIAYVHAGVLSLLPEKWTELNEHFVDTPYEMNKDIRVTQELLSELNIPYVNVFSALMEHPVEEVYYIYDGHFTPKGAEVIATCLRDYLMEVYWRDAAVRD